MADYTFLQSTFFAATSPDRVSALVLVNAFARTARAPDFHPGMPPQVRAGVMRGIDTGWGTGAFLDVVMPDQGDMDEEWFARYQGGVAASRINRLGTRRVLVRSRQNAVVIAGVRRHDAASLAIAPPHVGSAADVVGLRVEELPTELVEEVLATLLETSSPRLLSSSVTHCNAPGARSSPITP